MIPQFPAFVSARGLKWCHPITNRHVSKPNPRGASCPYETWLLTYELLVPHIQRHVAQSRCDRAHHPVIIHPQQLHQDGQPLLLTHRRPDVRRKLATETHHSWVSKQLQMEEEERVGDGIKGLFRWKRTFQLPADRFWREPAAPSRVAGLELSASNVKYGLTTEGCHSISAPLGHLEKPGMGPTPSH